MAVLAQLRRQQRASREQESGSWRLCRLAAEETKQSVAAVSSRWGTSPPPSSATRSIRTEPLWKGRWQHSPYRTEQRDLVIGRKNLGRGSHHLRATAAPRPFLPRTPPPLHDLPDPLNAATPRWRRRTPPRSREPGRRQPERSCGAERGAGPVSPDPSRGGPGRPGRPSLIPAARAAPAPRPALRPTYLRAAARAPLTRPPAARSPSRPANAARERSPGAAAAAERVRTCSVPEPSPRGTYQKGGGGSGGGGAARNRGQSWMLPRGWAKNRRHRKEQLELKEAEAASLAGRRAASRCAEPPRGVGRPAVPGEPRWGRAVG